MRLALVLESNTDRRILEGLGERTDLTVVARQRRLSEFPARVGRPFRVVVGPESRAAYGRFVTARLLSERFDAVIAQGYFVAALGAGLAGRTFGRRPTLFVCNPMESYYRCRAVGDWPDRPFRRGELSALEAVARVNARLAGRYVVLSEHLGDVVRGHGTRAPVDVVPAYGVDRSVFRPATKPRSELRRELGLPDDEAPIVFFSSRVAPEKDAGSLLHALGGLRSEGRRFWLLSCGRQQDMLIAAAESVGIGDRLIARDMVDPGEELARHYQASDVVVQASKEEGLGFAPLEALACGTPVVATAVGGLRETIRDGETGWSYAAGDVAGLATALEQVIDDPEEAARRTRAGSAMVAERYDPAAAFDRLVELAAAP